MADDLAGIENKTIDLVVRSRTKTYFNGKARSVSSDNETGVFDVLPQHANFITMVSKFINVVLPDGKEQKFEIKGGVLRAMKDHVDIYLTV